MFHKSKYFCIVLIQSKHQQILHFDFESSTALRFEETNSDDIGFQSHWLWHPIHMTLAFKVNAIENTGTYRIFSGF